MILVFAYVASRFGLKDWPVEWMYAMEAFFVTSAIVCLLMLLRSRSRHKKSHLQLGILIGGICAAFAVVMPLELAPFFFHIGGEIMLATFGIAPFAYVVMSLLCVYLVRKLAPQTHNDIMI